MSWNKAKFISTEASLQPFHQTLIIGNAESHNFCYAIFGIPGPFFMLKSACWRPLSADFANIFRSDGHLLYTQEPAVLGFRLDSSCSRCPFSGYNPTSSQNRPIEMILTATSIVNLPQQTNTVPCLSGEKCDKIHHWKESLIWNLAL